MKSIDIHIRHAKQLVTLLDTKYTLIGIKFGIDPLLNIIPGFGSLIGSVTSCYLIWLAYKLRAPLVVYVRMIINIILDFVLGSIPAVGIVFDLFYRSNYKNFRLLESYFQNEVVEEDIIQGEVLDGSGIGESNS